MEYVLSKKALAVSETVFEGTQEQPIDLDFNLPDYCPDIQKILKCQVIPKIYTRNISGDRLDVDGAACVKVIYVDEIKKCVRCCEQIVPFSSSFNLKTTPQNAVILSKAKNEYINCRAISPRRLDIHGAFSVSVQVICKNEKQLPEFIEGDDIQMKTKPFMTSSLTGLGQQQFTISEKVELGSDRPPIESIIKTSAKVNLLESQAITNKIMLKAELNIRVMYLTDIELGEIDIMEYTCPISQILDVDGVDESCICYTDLDILSYDIRQLGDIGDDTPVLSIEAKVVATSRTYIEEEVQTITDAYSTKYDLNLTYSQVPYEKVRNIITDSCIAKNTVEAGTSGVSKIIDIWNDDCIVTAEEENGQMVFSGKADVCILALDSEQNIFYAERVVEFSHAIAIEEKEGEISSKVQARVLSVSYRLNTNGGIDLRVEVKLYAAIIETVVCRSITEASADEERLRKKDDNSALTLYFAEEGEKVWNIAREYCISCDSVKAENDLDDEVVSSKKMLLIPNM